MASYDPPYGYAVRRNATCAQSETVCANTWSTWHVCCPENTVCAPGGSCCPTDSDCRPAVNVDAHCANNATWDLYYENGYFCCDSDTTGFLASNLIAGGVRTGGVGCASGFVSGEFNTVLVPVNYGSDSASRPEDDDEDENEEDELNSSSSSSVTTPIETSTSTAVEAGETSTTTSTPITTTALPDSQPTSDTDNGIDTDYGSDSSTNVGAIAGGVVGGVIGIALIIALIWFLRRRRRREQPSHAIEEVQYPAPGMPANTMYVYNHKHELEGKEQTAELAAEGTTFYELPGAEHRR
ncbi:hypothetical protein BJY04DRAFT_218114 [Aspergillus karnatakaensis]|uniref:uncharacterized protein n=1 Tax=Aspergillus karnatakaensis TaxID=1810916 RepID=UPI003CCDA7D5